MELREFAEKVLYGRTLEEKLQGVDQVTDDHPGPSVRAPDTPGRPAELHFRRSRSERALERARIIAHLTARASFTRFVPQRYMGARTSN